MDIQKILAEEFKIKPEHVANIVTLVDEGNTIPFIARYRKEMTGSCDDQVLRELHERLSYLRNLEKRKEEIVASITEQEKMTDELSADIAAAQTLARLEDIYRPFKQKRRTRATVAKERGLEPLAQLIVSQTMQSGDILAEAERYLDGEKGVTSVQEAIEGAKDIIAELVSDDAQARQMLRTLFERTAMLTTAAATEEDSVYSMYYDYSEPVSKIPSHRILAVNRGEKEGFLKVGVDVDEERAVGGLRHMFIKGKSITDMYLEEAIADAYKRLIFPSLEREIRAGLTQRADEQAIKIFGLNLKALLMQPPIKGKVTLGFDPAYRTGCKIAVVDATGKVLDTTVVYPTAPQKKVAEAKAKLTQLITKYQVDVIAIGNGTASKESEIFVAELIGEIDRRCRI